MQCSFCNVEVEEKGHIGKCPNCAGQTHLSGELATCACCGKSFPAKVKAQKVEPLAQG